MTKKEQVNFGIERIKDILGLVSPKKAPTWRIEYVLMTEEYLNTFGEWDAKYHGLRASDEYIIIYDSFGILYAINVTADSTLLTLSELMKVLCEKF